MFPGFTFSTAYRSLPASSVTLTMARSSPSYWHSSCLSPPSFSRHSPRQPISTGLSVVSSQTMACLYPSSLLLAWHTGDVLTLHTQPSVALFSPRMEEHGWSDSGNLTPSGSASLSHLASYCGSCSFLTTMSLYVLSTTRFPSIKRLISMIVTDSTGFSISPPQASRFSLRLFPARNCNLHCRTDRRSCSEWIDPSSTHPYSFSRCHGPSFEEIRQRSANTDTRKT